MKQYNKQILEAINRGIKLALDDYDIEDQQIYSSKHDIVQDDNILPYIIENFVDLDLPSRTLWAKCNLGSSKPEQVGNYYAWGEIEPGRNFKWDNYRFGKISELKKYNQNDKLSKLQLEDDVAYINSNGMMQIPTSKQCLELLKYTNIEYTTFNNVHGFKLTSKKYADKFIFIPLSGTWLDNIHPNYLDAEASFWTSNLCIDKDLITYNGQPEAAWQLTFSTNGKYEVSAEYLYFGYNIRPVFKRN